MVAAILGAECTHSFAVLSPSRTALDPAGVFRLADRGVVLDGTQAKTSGVLQQMRI